MIIPTSVTAHGGSTMTLTFSEAVGGAAMLGLGGGSDNITGRTFNFDQETASTIWRVTHSLGEQYPAITIYDENDEVIVPGRIHATNPGETSIYFEHATSGHGHFSVGNGLPGINSDNAGNFMRINSDGTQIEYVTSTQNVTGSFPISGSLTLTGSMFVSETGSFGRIGANVISALKRTTGDIILIQDADLEYDPQEFPLVIQPIVDGKADVVFGSRFQSGRPHRVVYFWHRIGNGILTVLSNILTDLNLTDMETCYKAFKREVIQSITIEEKRFGFEPEVTAKISKKNLRIYEVGISYYGRTYSEGKKIGWKDGVRAIYCILKYNTWKAN